MLIVSIPVFCPVPIALADGLILNEYNAVDRGGWLNGGGEFADDDGGLAGDLTFGRVQGNDGDWFELVVTEDRLDLRGWKLVLSEDGSETETLVLGQDNVWTTLKAGTIITISEDQSEDVSYDSMAGDWLINVQAENNASGTYITASSFPVSKDDWQIEIFDALDVSQFGPAGEGVGVLSGVNGREIARLEEDPSIYIAANSVCFDDAKTALGLIPGVEDDSACVTADAAYDAIAIYDAAAAHGAKVIVPPRQTAKRSKRPPLAIAQSDESGKSGFASGRRNRDTTSGLAWRTPSPGTSRSLATASGLVISSHRRLKGQSHATSSTG